MLVRRLRTRAAAGPTQAGRPRVGPAFSSPVGSTRALPILVENHQRFLTFLERRVGSRETAEDLLQDGFVRALERASTIRDDESVVAWFYRVLRNALVDHYRRGASKARALASFARDVDEEVSSPDDELEEVLCHCVMDLVGTLKPEYRAAIRRVDLEGASVAEYARETGITPNNASVRLHRAHEALRRQLVRCCRTCVTHECVDCRCGGGRATRSS